MIEDILTNFGKTELVYLTMVAFGSLIAILGWIAKKIITMQKEFMRQFILLKIENQSTDYAIGKSLGNGYEADKLQKKKELLGDHNFIHEGI